MGNNQCHRRGFSLIEIILGVSILAIVLIAAVSAVNASFSLNRQALLSSQAGFLTAEGAEIVRSFRDRGWANISGLSSGTEYFLVWNGANWATTTVSSEIDGIFYRKMTASDVYRDVNDDIISSGGTLDAGTRKIRIETNWSSGTESSTKSIELYLANI